ncbi:hypothetical protein ABT063_38165 [Streptomyces sp. NPDC002838]
MRELLSVVAHFGPTDDDVAQIHEVVRAFPDHTGATAARCVSFPGY